MEFIDPVVREDLISNINLAAGQIPDTQVPEVQRLMVEEAASRVGLEKVDEYLASDGNRRACFIASMYKKVK